MPNKKEQWLSWVNELQALAQVGRTYCKDDFCQERYQRLTEIAAHIASTYSDSDFDAIKHLFSLEKKYATPNIDVRAVVIVNQKILMVKEASDGLWSLPGGWADVNTSAAESAVREVFEETGYVVKATKLLAFYDKLKHTHPPEWPHAYKAIFLCELLGGTATISHETLAIDFFAEDALPELSLNRITKEQIHRMFEHYKHPDLPADFD